MPEPPKLSICIPHLDRTELLERTIKSCLAQTVPVHIIVSDQAHKDSTAEMLARYPQVEHIRSKAKSLQGNWETALRACDTPYASICQDDDVIAPGYARRIVNAFEAFPDALHWQARLACSVMTNMACWYLGSGPWVPLDLISGRADKWNGSILTPCMYFNSWSLSPAVAFRCGQSLNDALEAMPDDCAIFSERLILAELGVRGPWVADPLVAGYWMQHSENESRKQWHDQPRQTRILVDHLDRLMDSLGKSWQEPFSAWLKLMVTAHVVTWIGQIGVTRQEGRKSKYLDEIESLMVDSLQGRVEVCAVQQPSKPRPRKWRLPRISFPRFSVGPEPLYDIAIRHGTDKERYHHYTQHYEAAFGSIRDQPVTLLEIGVGGYDAPDEGGESLRMWQNYFPKGRIHGIDIAKKTGLDRRRITTHQGSQTDPDFLAAVVAKAGPLDIVVDDGSHNSDDIVTTFKLLWPHVKLGGWYVVEDTRTSYLVKHNGSPYLCDKHATTMGFFQSLCDSLNGADWVDENDGFQNTIESISFKLNLIFIRKLPVAQEYIPNIKTRWVKV